MNKLSLSLGALFISASFAFAAGQADMAGSYAGKTAKGGLVRLNIPASGTPSYAFRGQSVQVNAAKMSGKSMVLDVGTGHGTVTLTPAGKGKIAWRYHFQGDKASATLTKE